MTNLTDRFTALLADSDLDVVDDGFIVNSTGTAEMVRVNGAWLVRAADAEDGVLMDRWDAARALRDWDEDHDDDTADDTADDDELVGAAA